MSASRRRSPAEPRWPAAMPMLALTVRQMSLFSPSLKGGCQRGEQALGHQLHAGARRDFLGDHHELVPAQASERVRLAHDRPSAFAATDSSSSSPTAWPSVSLTLLKSSRSMNSADVGVCVRAERASIPWRRARIRVRKENSVNGSWVARSARCLLPPG